MNLMFCPRLGLGTLHQGKSSRPCHLLWPSLNYYIGGIKRLCVCLCEIEREKEKGKADDGGCSG